MSEPKLARINVNIVAIPVIMTIILVIIDLISTRVIIIIVIHVTVVSPYFDL